MPHILVIEENTYTQFWKKKQSARVQNHPVHKFPPLPPKKKNFFSSAYQQISNKKG